MTINQFTEIAKLYGYTVDMYTTEGVTFDDKEVPLNISEIQKTIPKQILAISAEILNSENIFAIFLDDDNPSISGIIAIEFIELNTDKRTLLDLDILDTYQSKELIENE
ncbi:hypothetical protein [Cetobacterium sp.]|uniref:hypothetical protein n=1 Tax=Cetobacterium sp. TaxID=2071632 RepID=UPI003F3C0FF1